MKLSKAIREGAKLRPQGFWRFFPENGVVKSCSLGAAFEATFGHRDYSSWRDLLPYYPELEGKLVDRIVHMNDVQLMTREQIADWVEEQGY